MGRPFFADELQAAATRRTGLSDFGDLRFRADLDALLDALNHDAQLHAAGRMALRRIVTDHLVNRLLLTSVRQQAPGIFTRPLANPLIVTGLPRSGTTLLHRMLAADPAHYGPPYWELAQPVAPSVVPPGWPDHRRWYAAATLGLRGLLARDLDRKHFVAVDTPEEDLHTLGATFQSWYYWMAAPVYGYLDWYLSQDYRRKYREYRAWLQVLQAAHPGHRLVLKSPEHTGGLAALLDAVPEAHVVQLHRDPRTSFASFVSLTRTTQHMFTGPIDHARSARASLSLLSRNCAATWPPATGIPRPSSTSAMTTWSPLPAPPPSASTSGSTSTGPPPPPAAYGAMCTRTHPAATAPTTTRSTRACPRPK